jgi:putative heme iron utilization protein
MGWLEAADWKDAAILPLEEEEKLLSDFGNAGILGIDYYGVDLLRDGKRKRMQFANACHTPADIETALRGLRA